MNCYNNVSFVAAQFIKNKLTYKSNVGEYCIHLIVFSSIPLYHCLLLVGAWAGKRWRQPPWDEYRDEEIVKQFIPLPSLKRPLFTPMQEINGLPNVLLDSPLSKPPSMEIKLHINAALCPNLARGCRGSMGWTSHNNGISTESSSK
jgi:hypothetical protein